MISEYAGDRNLSDYLLNRWGQALGEVEARYFIIQLLQGINYCHQKGIVHGNLSCTNILMSETYDHGEYSDEYYVSDTESNEDIDENEIPEDRYGFECDFIV